MRIPGKFSSLLIGAIWLALAFSRATAQEDAAPAPSPQPAPAPATAEPVPYPLDLPDLHPPSNGTGLFPNGPRQNAPAPTSGNPGRNRRNPLTKGSKQRGRSLDLTLQKADADPLKVRIAYRRDKTTALARDPELTELLRRADASGTDAQKRVYLHEYYTRLFASIRRMDSSADMKVHLALLAQVAEQRYDPKRRAVAGEEDLLNTRESASVQRLGR